MIEHRPRYWVTPIGKPMTTETVVAVEGEAETVLGESSPPDGSTEVDQATYERTRADWLAWRAAVEADIMERSAAALVERNHAVAAEIQGIADATGVDFARLIELVFGGAPAGLIVSGTADHADADQSMTLGVTV